MIKLNFRFLLIAASLMTAVSADCSKEEILKLVSKDFSKQEIKSICSDDNLESTSTKWIKLIDKDCIDFGGEMYYGECLANWSNATKICRVVGGRLATRLELKNSIVKCGGMINEYDTNSKSKSYQECYKKEGFSSIYDYWSSTACGLSENDTWVAYIGSGNVYTYDKVGNSYVKCVKDEK